MAQDGYEYKHAWSGRYTECLQPDGEDIGRFSVLLQESYWDEAVEVGSQRASH